MKKVTAIIRHYKTAETIESLTAAGFGAMTVTEARGRGIRFKRDEVPDCLYDTRDLLPKVNLDVLVDDHDAEKAAEIIQKAARTGQVGDGVIYITDVSHAIRIRTGETLNNTPAASGEKGE